MKLWFTGGPCDMQKEDDARSMIDTVVDVLLIAVPMSMIVAIIMILVTW